jgi:NAD(P)-dependent dehydrogenase (short-subunit alcohol dehydrogenase family)
MSGLYHMLIYKPPVPTKQFTNRTIIVTGSNIGIGKEAVRHFVRLNAAKVILAVRNVPAGEEAAADIEASTSRSGITEVWKLDLASYASVKAFIERAKRDLERVDVLVLNAAVATSKFGRYEGLETMVTVNAVGNAMLLVGMLPRMRETARKLGKEEERPHIVLVGSGIHHWLDLKPSEYKDGEILTRLSREEGWPRETMRISENYIYSKELQALLVREWAGMIDPEEVVLNHNCPGLVQSGLRRELKGPLAWALDRAARTTEVGSRTLMMGATIGKESHGQALSNAKIQEGYVGVRDTGYSKFVLSAEGKVMQKRVWKEVKAILEKEGIDVDGAFAPRR